MTRSGRTPASTILLSSASPMRDGTHSLSRLDQRPPSSGYQLPSSVSSLISALGLTAEARVNVNREARGLRRKMKWRSGKGESARCGGEVIKHPPHFLHSRVFGKPLHDLRLSEFPEAVWWAIIWASMHLQPISPFFHHNLELCTEYSPTSLQYHQGSVTSTVQPLFRLFLHYLIYLRFPLVARGLHHHYALVSHHTRDFLLVAVVSNPSTT